MYQFDKILSFSEMINDISTAVKHFINITILMISGFKPAICHIFILTLNFKIYHVAAFLILQED